jgi:hypothetical protein
MVELIVSDLAHKPKHESANNGIIRREGHMKLCRYSPENDQQS